MSSPSWKLRTASPRGRYGERRQRDPRLKHTYIKTPPVGRRQPMTSPPARPRYKGRRENTSFSSSSSLTGLFEACHSGKSSFLSIMASTSKAFKKCVDPCPRYFTPDDTHNLCVFCLGKEQATAMSLRGKSACNVSFFSMSDFSALVCPSFQGKRGSRLLPAIRDPPLPMHRGG